MTETNRIEYKEKLSKDLDIEKEVVAFLNYREGGLIYIGIDKTGKTFGVEDIDGDMLKIKDCIKNNILPSAMGLFDVVEEEKDGIPIIKIIVASGSEKPYFKKKYGMTEKGCYVRLGTASEPMPQKQIEDLFSSRTRNSIGKIRSNRQDLSFEQLHIYYQAKKKNLNKKFLENLELLTPQGELNYAGYLLADDNTISIKVAKYKGTTKVNLIESNEYGYCSLIKATKSVLDKVNLENRTATKITAKERIEYRLWDEVALREAIINAMVHNDYTMEIAPTIEIFSDKITITSAGSLPNNLSEQDFFEGLSIPRNKELMRIFKDLELVEQLGSGVPRILESYGRNCFRFFDNFIRMTFPFDEEVMLALQNEEEGNNQDGNQESNQESNQENSTFKISVEKLNEILKKIAEIHPIEKEYNEKIIDKYKAISKELNEDEIKILKFTYSPKKKREILEECLGISNQTKNFKFHTERLLSEKLLSRTIENKPTSKFQKYFTTNIGKVCLHILESE